MIMNAAAKISKYLKKEWELEKATQIHNHLFGKYYNWN